MEWLVMAATQATTVTVSNRRLICHPTLHASSAFPKLLQRRKQPESTVHELFLAPGTAGIGL